MDEVIKTKKQSTYNELKYYCLAVAIFKSNPGLAILTELNKRETYPYNYYFPHNQEYIFTAIHKYPNQLYDKLYNELEPLMPEHVIKYINEPDYPESMTW